MLVGRNSIDGETGQVGPELAQLLGLPFASGVRRLEDRGSYLRLGLEHDDGSQEVEIQLPAVLSVAERLCDPCKVDPEGRAAVPADRLTRITLDELGPGPWGEEGSPTVVGQTRPMEHERSLLVLRGSLDRAGRGRGARARGPRRSRSGHTRAGPGPGTGRPGRPDGRRRG